MRISNNDSERYKGSRPYRNTATTVLCCTGCCSVDWISDESCVLLLTQYNQRSYAIITEPHLFHTLCLHYQIPVYSGRNFAPADLIITIV